MPRNRKSPTGERRDRAIRVHMSATEQSYLQERAGALSLSEYLLRAGLGQSIPQRRKRQRVPLVNRELLLELGKIGGNLNQMARACSLAVRQGMGCSIDPAILRDLAAAIQRLSYQVGGIDPTEDEDP
ncbi:MAG: hypothetical protein WCA35_30240 [Kovacikia sp.]|jgi:hypothetical protein